MARILVGIMLLIVVALPRAAQAVEGSVLQITPSSVSFGEVELGGEGLRRELEVVNRSGARLFFGSIAVEGRGADAFSAFTDRCPESLAEGEGCTVIVDFQPPSAGQWSADLVFAAPQLRESVPLSGTASAGARLSSDPGNLDFGSVAGTETRTLAVTLAPLGEGTLGIVKIQSPPAPFSVASDACSGLSLSPGQNCRVELRFSPQKTGTFSGDLKVSYKNPASREASIPVKGVRSQVSTPAPSQPEPPSAEGLDISTRSLNFGPVAVGFGQERQIMLRNTGTTPYNVGVVGGSDPLGAPFSVAADNCSKRAIAPGGNCRVTVRFAPTQTGAPGDSIDFPTDSPNLGNVRVAVRGEGVSSPLAAIVVRDRLEWEDDGELPFGELLLGRSAVTSVTVSNLGSAPLAITDVGVEDALAPPFFLRSDGCSGQVLPPGGECGIQVRFTPRTAGTFSDSFNIRSDDPRRPSLSVALTGAGTIVPGNNPPEAPSLIHPEPGQTNLRDTVTFRWSRRGDPDGDPVFYQVFLSTTPDFTFVEPRLAEVPEGLRLAGFGAAALALAGAPLLRGRRRWMVVLLLVLALAAACSDEVEDSAVLEIGDLDPQTIYFWKVMSDDGRGGLAESEVRSFTTR